MTVAVGMSGGVDSTVAAWLLKQQGHALVGLTMQIWDGAVDLPDEGRSGCYGPGEARDLASARAVAERLGIRHVTVPLAAAYSRCVLDPFRSEYRAGRTPNPCVMCNQKLKFGLLLAQAREQGIAFDAFATGHYARVALDAARQVYTLRRGLDATKDQSYFLARLTQAQLRQVIFPLGERLKSDVVRLAREAGFGDIADREESQDFIESESYAPLFGPGDDRPGPLVDTAGRTLGQHRGIVHYTVGQRQGLGVATGDRLHVKELRPETNTVVLGRREEVFSDACRVADVNWIAGEPPPDGTTCHIRLRYRHAGVAAVIRSLAGGAAVRMMAVEPAAEAAAGLPAEAGTPTAGARVPPSGGSLSGLQPRAEDAPAITQTAAGNVWQADFAAPQFAVAPGQAAVFYAGDEVLGGGWISR